MGIIDSPAMRRGTMVVALLLAGSTSGVGLAAPKEKVDEVVVNWATATVEVSTIGVADRRAPTPQIASAAARRRGIDRAKEKLRAAVLSLAWNDSQRVDAALTSAMVDQAMAQATLTSAEPLPDGSWRVRMTLGLQSLRHAGTKTIATPLAKLPATAHSDVIVVAAPNATPSIAAVPCAATWHETVPAQFSEDPRPVTLEQLRNKASSGGLSSSTHCVILIGKP